MENNVVGKHPIRRLLGSTQVHILDEITEARLWLKGRVHIITEIPARGLTDQPTFCNGHGLTGSKEPQFYLKGVATRDICKKCLQSLLSKVHLIVENLRGVLFNIIGRLLQPQDIILQAHSFYRAPLSFIKVINAPYKPWVKERAGKTITITVAASRYPEDEKIFTHDIQVYDFERLAWIKGSVEKTIEHVAGAVTTEIINHFGLIGSASNWQRETEEEIF